MKVPEPVLIGAVLAFTAIGATLVWRGRKGGRNRERERRLKIEVSGRVTDGYVTAYENGLVEYSWSWCGVSYSGAQDIRDLLIGRPELPMLLRGRVHVRLLPENPHSSIVVSENWSGLTH